MAISPGRMNVRPDLSTTRTYYGNPRKPGSLYGSRDQQISSQPTYGAEQFETTYKSGYKPSSYRSAYSPTGYNPTKFNFQAKPEEYSNQAYEMGARQIRREGQGNLEKLQETIGTRRPGLLLKAAENSQRNIGEQLGGLSSQLSIERMKEQSDLAKEQQIQQAAEDYRAAGFNDDQALQLANQKYQEAQFGEEQSRFGAGEGGKEYESLAGRERNRADERFRNIESLNRTALDKIRTQSDLMSRERGYQADILNYLYNLLSEGKSKGGQKQGGGGFMNTLKDAAGIAATVAPLV